MSKKFIKDEIDERMFINHNMKCAFDMYSGTRLMLLIVHFIHCSDRRNYYNVVCYQSLLKQSIEKERQFRKIANLYEFNKNVSLQERFNNTMKLYES